MINWTLYKREMKGSIRLLLILGAVITLYVTCIISMYDPELMAYLDGFVEAMPELMAAVGMTAGASSLLGFMISYLYGFIFLIFPMVFCILRGNGLIAKYVDSGAMVSLVAAPVKRRTIAFTQLMVLTSCLILLLAYSTVLEIVTAAAFFPGELDIPELLILNGGLLCLHFAIGGICFLASCAFSDTKYSIAFGAGIPSLMYVLQMLANVGEELEVAKYATLFTLFDPEGLAAGTESAFIGAAVLLAAGVVLSIVGITVFSKKDLHI